MKSGAWVGVAQPINSGFPLTKRTEGECEKRYRNLKANQRPVLRAQRRNYAFCKCFIAHVILLYSGSGQRYLDLLYVYTAIVMETAVHVVKQGHLVDHLC